MSIYRTTDYWLNNIFKFYDNLSTKLYSIEINVKTATIYRMQGIENGGIKI